MTAISHIIESEMRSFCAGTLSASDTIRCAEHLESCPQCNRLFSEVSTVRRVPAVGRVLRSPETLVIGRHLDYEEISSYLDRGVSKEQREFIKLHLDLCRECAKDLSSLREFRESVDSELRGQNPNRGVLYRLTSYWKQIRYFNPVQVFGAIALSTLLALLGALVYRWPDSGVPSIANKKIDGPSDSRHTMFDTVVDSGRQFMIRYEGDRITIDGFAPELHEDAVELLRRVKSGEPPARGESVSQADNREIEDPTGKYFTHFELGVYYLTRGQLEKAGGEFQQLREANPDSKLVEKIYFYTSERIRNRRN